MTETKEKYLQTVDELEHITGIAWTLSLETTNRKVDSWREQYCSYIFAKLCLHAQAVLYLKPELDLQDPYLLVT